MNLAAEIPKMTTIERLQVMESVWDSLIHDTIEPPSPNWHGYILEQRQQKIATGQDGFISVEELRIGPR